MDKLLLLGDEAIAQGAIDAGISGVFAYPGTPSTEITEYIQGSKEAKENGIRKDWAANEKTAMEASLGMSYAGKRAMFCCKHVGINVAADCFVNSAITGVNGGLVYVAADDPSMHSSQNEQDSRFYADFAFIPCLEPSNQQEAYDMTRYAFDISEAFKVPVMLRITTRLAHSRASVERKAFRAQNDLHLPADKSQFILLPAIARKSYVSLLGKQEEFTASSIDSPFNKYVEGKDHSMGIIACGIGYNYLMENFKDGICPFPVLKISQYPLPDKLVVKLMDECKEILVLEEGQPIYERLLKGLLNRGKDVIKGRLDGTLPRVGELNPNLVAKALGLKVEEGPAIPDLVVARPPKMCVGCPHIDSYTALNEAMKGYKGGRVFSDIGCYTLGALPPFEAIYSTVDMGASITMAKGASEAGVSASVAVIGDSTFTHSGMTGLLDCCNDHNNVTILILDNDITGMTGSQKSSATGKIESICMGLGVAKEHIRVIKPLPRNHEENVKVMREEIEYNGVSVIIPRRECIVWMGKKLKLAKMNAKK